MKIGFIGTGVITEAIVRGLIAHRDSEEQIILSERSRDISARLAALSPRVRIETNNQRIVDQSDLVFLAVLPHLASDIIGPLNFREGQTVASLIASVPHEQLRSWTGGGVEIVRAIPLPAVAEGRGTTVLFPDNQYLAGLFGDLGTVFAAKTQTAFDAYAGASALMGTYFGFLETAAGWLTNQGCDPQGARHYLAGVFSGLAQRSDADRNSSFAELRVAHSTPKGLNEQLFEVFTASGGVKALEDGLRSVAERLQEAH